MPERQILEQPLARGREPEEALAELGRLLEVAGFTRAKAAVRGEAAFDSPGYRSSKQSPILGAGRVVASAGGGKLRVEADMRGARFLARFALWFPLGLATVLGLGLPPLLMGSLNPVFLVIPAPWLVVGPLMAKAIMRNSERALGAVARHAAG